MRIITLPAVCTSLATLFTSSLSTSVIQEQSYWYPPLRKKCIAPIAFLRSAGKSQRGGRALVDGPHNLNTATLVSPFLWTTAFTKCVVPMLTLATCWVGFGWNSSGSCLSADLIASVIPDVISFVVVTLAEHNTSFFLRMTASVFVPPTSTPMQSHMVEMYYSHTPDYGKNKQEYKTWVDFVYTLEGYLLVMGYWGCAAGWGCIFTSPLTIMGSSFQAFTIE